MFSRRDKPSLFQRTRGVIWPRAGWRRSGRYIAHRISRMPDTPRSIAIGVASGAAVSFTPFIGLHFLLAAVLAWALRGNILASAIGTAVGNPWTFPFIWVVIYWIGRVVVGSERTELPTELSVQHFLDHPVDVFLPMVIGGIPLAIVMWVVFYFLTHRLVVSFQSHRRRRREKKLAHRARMGSGAGQEVGP